MPMGLYRVLQGFPGATISGETSTRGKQPDYVWCPADGNVKMCLTLRVDRENNEIRMESWIRQEDTDNNGRMRICRNQVMYVRMKAQSRPTVTADCLFRISLESLMLRPIDNRRTAEKDFLFSRADLENVAESIWNAEWE